MDVWMEGASLWFGLLGFDFSLGGLAFCFGVGLMQANSDFFFGFVPNRKFRSGTLCLLGKCLNWFW